jgi:hypothetical protein
VVFDHREREINTWGVGAVGSVQEGYPGSTSDFKWPGDIAGTQVAQKLILQGGPAIQTVVH